MLGTGAVHVDTKSAYLQSFGLMEENTPYVNGWMGVDQRSELQNIVETNMKALGTTSATAGGVGTAGVAMVPVYLDPRIVDTTRKYTPLVELVPRVTNMGLTADFNTVTAKGTAISASEDAPLQEQDDTYDRSSVSMKFLYAVGRVTGQAQAAYPSYVIDGFQASGSGLAGSAFANQSAPNAKQLNVIMKARSMRELEENLILNGNATTSTGDGADGTEFNGIVTQQSTTNKVDKNTTALEYDDIETALQYAFDDGGRPNIAVASSSVVGDLRKIVVDTFHYRPADMATSLPFGVSSQLVLDTMVGPVPIIPSMYLSNTSGSKSIYFLDMNFIEMRVLQDMTYEELAKTNDSQKFMLKIYEALVMKNTAFNSFIGEISA